jgi:mannan endo-1,4-beta-mannosidase
VLAAGGDAERYIASPDVDALSVHYYQYWDKLGGGSGDIAAMLARDAASLSGRKPLFADEFGLADTQTLTRFIGVLVNSEVSGGLLWGMRSHRRDSGFYYHNESGTGFDSYHWPGFANGASYDEQMVLRFLRESAFKIRGLAVPDPPPPVPAPVLLPISPAGELRWKGSAGAAGYDVERAKSKDGPWTVVATDVSDEVVPAIDVASFEAQWEDSPVCAPPALWKDSPDRQKGPYYYRVRGKNAAGATAYSNIMVLK